MRVKKSIKPLLFPGVHLPLFMVLLTLFLVPAGTKGTPSDTKPAASSLSAPGIELTGLPSITPELQIIQQPDSLAGKQTTIHGDSARIGPAGKPYQTGSGILTAPDSPERNNPDSSFPPAGTYSPEMALPAGKIIVPDIPLSEAISLTAIPFSGDMILHPRFPEWQPPDFSSLLFSRWRSDAGHSLYYPLHLNPLFFSGSAPLLFGGTATLFSQASYQLSDRLQVGGNSFGISPPWARPSLPGGDNRYDFRGASMFMEYKVSPNFRIGTSISVSGNQFTP